MAKRAQSGTKKQLILEVAREVGAERWTRDELEEVRRGVNARLGEAGRTGIDYVAEVLKQAGARVVWSARADTGGRFEEEFEDLLHFSTLQEAEACLKRLDELWRRFRQEGEAAAAARVLEVARRGKLRAEMIARNPRVKAEKRAEKEEIATWFRIWLETPEAFSGWLEVRKATEEFRRRFPGAGDWNDKTTAEGN